MKYYKEIDILKGCAITAVLLGHSILVYPVNLHTIPWCHFLHFLMSSFHMALFFSISGFCYRCNNYTSFISSKIYRLVIPYTVFSALNILCNFFFSSLINGSSSLREGIIDAVFYGSEYWFLYTLFLIFVTFPAVEKLLTNRRRRIIVLSVLFTAKMLPFIPGLLNLDNIIKYYSFFTIGYYVRTDSYFKELFNRNKTHKTTVILLCLVSWVGLAVVDYYAKKHLSAIVYSILESADAMAGICFFTLFSYAISGEKGSLYLQKVGKVSLPLYLFNGYLLVISRTVACRYFGWQNPILIISWNMLITLGVSFCIIQYIVLKIPLFRKAVGMK